VNYLVGPVLVRGGIFHQPFFLCLHSTEKCTIT
jgi:hypothetical protein